jgi:hypothetical protein
MSSSPMCPRRKPLNANVGAVRSSGSIRLLCTGKEEEAAKAKEEADKKAKDEQAKRDNAHRKEGEARTPGAVSFFHTQ